MTDIMNNNSVSWRLAGLAELKRNKGWLLALGIGLVVLGFIAIGASAMTTILSVFFLGCILLLGGVVQVAHAFSAHRWSGFFIHLLVGILYLITGLLMTVNPTAAGVSITLIMAMFFLVEGAFRIVTTLFARFPHWGWQLISGIVTLLLGMIIWSEWPISGLIIIGVFVGVNMIFNGWGLIMLAAALKNTAD